MASPIPVLKPGLKAALEQYRAKRNFKPDEWITGKCRKLNDYMKRCGLKACVSSISGGVDSAVTLALCARAMKEEGSPIEANVGVCQPIHSSGWALERGKDTIKTFGAKEVVVDQSDLHTTLSGRVDEAVGVRSGESWAKGQLRSYMRTPVAYYVAQLYSQEGQPAIVMGTGNMDEDGFLAYFCKAGDGVVDVQLISDLHKSEVFTVASALGVPESITKAPPSADLWDGQTDEQELGFTYDFVELYTGTYRQLNEDEKKAFYEGLDQESKSQFDSWSQAAEKVHKRNFHKIAGVQNL